MIKGRLHRWAVCISRCNLPLSPRRTQKAPWPGCGSINKEGFFFWLAQINTKALCVHRGRRNRHRWAASPGGSEQRGKRLTFFPSKKHIYYVFCAFAAAARIIRSSSWHVLRRLHLHLPRFPTHGSPHSLSPSASWANLPPRGLSHTTDAESERGEYEGRVLLSGPKFKHCVCVCARLTLALGNANKATFSCARCARKKSIYICTRTQLVLTNFFSANSHGESPIGVQCCNCVWLGWKNSINLNMHFSLAFISKTFCEHNLINLGDLQPLRGFWRMWWILNILDGYWMAKQL
jgi:hypothetical protein